MSGIEQDPKLPPLDLEVLEPPPARTVQDRYLDTAPAVRAELAEELTVLFADQVALRFATMRNRWNVEGSDFQALSQLFERQATHLDEHVLKVAETIRMLGFYVPGPLEVVCGTSRLPRGAGVNDAPTMVHEMTLHHTRVIDSLRPLIESSRVPGAELIHELALGLLRDHTRMRWELRSTASAPSRAVALS